MCFVAYQYLLNTPSPPKQDDYEEQEDKAGTCKTSLYSAYNPSVFLVTTCATKHSTECVALFICLEEVVGDMGGFNQVTSNFFLPS